MGTNAIVTRNEDALDEALMADIRRELKQAESLNGVLERIMSNARRREYEASADYAVNETMAWLNGIPSGTPPEPEDIWRYCLDKYQYHQALPVRDNPHVEIDGTRFYFKLEENDTYWHERPAPDCPHCGSAFRFFAPIIAGYDTKGNIESVTCPECRSVLEVKR